MTDPDRLLSAQSSELTRALLSAAREDAPSEAAIQRTLLAVGAGATLLAASAGAASAGAASAGAASAGAASAGAASATGSALAKLGTASSSLLVTVKWLGIGALTGVLGAGAANQIKQRAHVSSTSPVATQNGPVRAREPQRERAPFESQEPVSTPSSVATPSSLPAASARLPRAAQAAKPAPRPAAPSQESVLLTEEVAALDRAREAVAARDPRRALLAIAAYEKQFSEQRLTPEALYLRMEAELQSGDRRAAESTAQHILRVDPNGPHAARARAVLAR